MRTAQFSCLITALTAVSLAIVPCGAVWAGGGATPAAPSTLVGRPTPNAPASAGNDLFVTTGQFCANPSVALLNPKTYTPLGTITNGLICPYSVNLDAKGNLYVADLGYTPNSVDLGTGNIIVYAPGATTPTSILMHGSSAVLSTGMFSVTTDKHGNVYGGTSGYYGNQSVNKASPGVVEWPKGNPIPFIVCNAAQNQPIVSVAVDSKGNVFFADYLKVEECTPQGTQAIIYLASNPGAVAVDTQDNLLFSIPNSGTISVSAPPYQSVTRTIGTGLVNPTDIKLNATNTLAYVADNGAGQYITINYQTGAVLSSVPVPGIRSAVKRPNAVNK